MRGKVEIGDRFADLSMDPSSSLLAQSLRECITPVVMLLPTPAVEESCQKNSLTFLDILRPFTTVEQIDVPVRTASDQPFRLQEFQLRLFYAPDIRPPAVENAEEQLLKVVNNASDEALAELSGEPQNLEAIKQMVEQESRTSWFQKYSTTFANSLTFSDHEAFDHPVACIRAVSSRDDNPMNKFVDLFNTDQMPVLMNDGIMDPKTLKIFVLVHDYQDGPADRAHEILSEMRGTFDFNDCWLLCINSGTLEDGTEDFWRQHMPPNGLPKQINNDASDSVEEAKLGLLLNDTDLHEITDLMAQLCCRSLLPYMEQKIRSLNQQVAATRKGLKNQLKNLWWRKGKDESLDPLNNSMYTFASIESQIRVLADYAFMLHDYELALSNYRLISSDYKTDKAWKHYAGVQEMIGLSLFMLDQSRKEAEVSMESAFSTYQKLVPSGQRYATRCALWWAEMHKARGQYREAASVFFRASTEEPHLRAGIFLEQAAYCYLRATTPLLRKYGFHLVLAGNRYNVCGQKKHAFRAYASVLTIFEGQGWKFINDHVLFHLGRLSAVLGDFSTAIEHFRKLICCSHQSATNQASFLREFIHIVQSSNQDKLKLMRLDLPSINMENLRVHFEDHRTYGSPDAVTVREDVWLQLEAGLVPSTPTTTTNWLDAASRQHTSNEADHFNVCIVGESISVDVSFGNPLQIPFNLSAVTLMYEFVSASSKANHGSSESSKDANNVDESFTATDSVPAEVQDLELDSNTKGPQGEHQHTMVHLIEESFTLKAGENFLANLKIIPREQGLLSITGVRWMLSGAVMGYQKFALKRRAIGKEKRVRARPPHECLKFDVQEHLPRLEVSMHGMPGKMNSGELRRIVLELSNTSDRTIKNIKFHSSHPGLLLIGAVEDLDVEIPSCLEARREDQQWTITGHPDKASFFAFPKTLIVEGKSTLLWPLWLHAWEAGTIQLNNVLYYEADGTTQLQYRTTRLSHTLEVLPSLQISVQISPCLLELDHFLLRLDVANKHSSESFWLRQVSCMGRKWKIAPLLPPVPEVGDKIVSSDRADAAFLSASVCPWQLLPASQTLSLFFQLLESDIEAQGGLASAGTEIFVSNVRLGPPSSSEPLIDVTNGPLYSFHVHERTLKKKEATDPGVADKEERILEGGIDLILISEQQDESSSEKQAALRESQRLVIHHACYCSVKQLSPIGWVIEGPKAVAHDFSISPSCTVRYFLTIKNSSSLSALVKVDMSIGHSSITNLPPSQSLQVNHAGWYDVALENPVISSPGLSADGKTMERMDSLKHAPDTSNLAVTSAAPFIWCSLNSFKIECLCSGHSETYPLYVTVFAPGIYDLSSYHVSWELMADSSGVVENFRTQECVVSSAAPTTWSSNSAPLESELSTTVPPAIHESRSKEPIAGSRCGHPLILAVEDKQSS